MKLSKKICMGCEHAVVYFQEKFDEYSSRDWKELFNAAWDSLDPIIEAGCNLENINEEWYRWIDDSVTSLPANCPFYLEHLLDDVKEA